MIRANPAPMTHLTHATKPFPTLLCCQGECGDLAQASVEVAGERALDAAACRSSGLAGGDEWRRD
jgi:hypothetical protein